MRSECEKMLNGDLYRASDEALQQASRRARLLTHQFNQTTDDDSELRRSILSELLGQTQEHYYIEPTFRCDYGEHIRIGNYFYANFDCIMLDVAPITIGEGVMFGPRVSLLTASHPIDATVRKTGLEYGLPITIGDNVWIGGSVTVNPGVSVGQNSVIGSGSVVTKSIPENVVAAGNPCRVIRKITEEDTHYWKQKQQDYWKETSHIE